jgi:poly(3-hydroxybutyrate) depolymerase
VIWLHPPGGYKDDELVAAWKDICAKHDLILLAPKSNDPARWQRTELGYIRKTLDEVVAKYHVDRNRIVVAGQEGGGGMAYLLAQANRDWIRGVVAIDAAIPAGSELLPNDPIQRLAFYIAQSEKSPAKAQIEATIKALRAGKYPVTVLDLGPTARGLSAAELTELARWIDALDRL